jgi:hypothetical protein
MHRDSGVMIRKVYDLVCRPHLSILLNASVFSDAFESRLIIAIATEGLNSARCVLYAPAHLAAGRKEYP